MYIRNSSELLSHGFFEGRRIAIDLIEAGIKAADPYLATKRTVALEGETLKIGDFQLDLNDYRNIYVLGAGKASLPIAKAVEEILGDKISKGIVVVRDRKNEELQRINIMEASHPIPDERSYKAAIEVSKIAKSAKEGDLIIYTITGGSSALLCMPPPEIPLEDKRELHRILLSCGANIKEINAVRKHISMIKGGRLALMSFPADIINLTVSDVIGDPLDYITGPTVPDSSTINDALRVLDKYNLWGSLPESVREHFRNITPEMESPKETDFLKIPPSFILVRCDEALRGASERCKELGLGFELYPEALEGESCDDALKISETVKNRIKSVRRPFVILAYGENVVELSDSHGKGGPNQEFALWILLNSPEDEKIVVASVDTDGSDGGTDAAGAIVDYSTLKFRDEIEMALRDHNCYEVLRKSGDLVFTGETGTNVNDLKVVILG